MKFLVHLGNFVTGKDHKYIEEAESEEELTKSINDSLSEIDPFNSGRDEILEIKELDMKRVELPNYPDIWFEYNAQGKCGNIDSNFENAFLKDEEDFGDEWRCDLGETCKDVLESLILAHACAGIDVSSKAYVEGIETAFESICSNMF